MSDTVEDDPIVWEHTLFMLGDRFLLLDLLKVIVGSVVGMQLILLIMGFVTEREVILLPPKVLGIVLGVMVFLFLIAILVAYGARYHARFTIDSKGVLSETGRKERKVNRWVLFFSLLSGRPQAIGASLIAFSRETDGVKWRAVRKVSVDPGKRVIVLKDSWHTIMRLYCTPENFDEVVGRVQTYTASAGRPQKARSKKNTATEGAPPERPRPGAGDE